MYRNQGEGLHSKDEYKNIFDFGMCCCYINMHIVHTSENSLSAK